MIFIFLNIVLGLSIISISYLLRNFYPKEINNLIGYRTKRSMASREAWEFANKYSAALLFKCSLFAVTAQLVFNFIFTGATALSLTAGTWIVVLIGTIIKTEIELRKKF
jgi:uncharacterized membrane protein